VAAPGEIGPWALSGTYLEACNCEVICPCRRIGGRQGGRSTYGVCLGALSWQIVEGHSGDTDLDGSRVVIVCRYSDDEPGSPWAFKPSNLVAVRPATIEIDHTPRRGWFRVGEEVTVKVAEAVAGQEPVTCVIPGHHRAGTEVVVDELRAEAPAIGYAFSGRCGYESSFEYSSRD
jgi:hypothetical protein